MSPVIKDFVGNIFRGRKVQVDKISVRRGLSGRGWDPTLENSGLMEVIPEYGTGSEAENERKWIITEDRAFVLAGTLHLRDKEGAWEWATLKEPVGAWIVNDWTKMSLTKTEEGDIDPAIIVEIAKLIPVPPMDLENRVSANKGILITPNYVPEY